MTGLGEGKEGVAVMPGRAILFRLLRVHDLEGNVSPELTFCKENQEKTESPHVRDGTPLTSL